MATVGTHCILELHACSSKLLDDRPFLEQVLRDAAKQGMSTLLNLTSHQFEPHGVTALALLAESHISIHTWPESGYAAVDVFTCGACQPERACRYIIRAVKARNHVLRTVPRGWEVPDFVPVAKRPRREPVLVGA